MYLAKFDNKLNINIFFNNFTKKKWHQSEYFQNLNSTTANNPP